MEVQVYRSSTPTLKLPLQSGTVNDRIMSDSNVVFEITSPKPLDIRIGDSITLNGTFYEINSEPTYELQHNRHSYTIVFESYRHRLSRQYIHSMGRYNFVLLGDADQILTLIINAMNEVDSGWTKGTVDASNDTHTSWSDVKCWDALDVIHETFGLEWQVVGKTISLKQQVGVVKPITLEYGKGNGLYSLERQVVSGTDIITRLKVYGGSRNLPSSYPYAELQLGHDLTKNIPLYGDRVGIYRNPEVYPSFTGAVQETNKVSASLWEITSSEINFNLNDYFTGDSKIVFKSGDLLANEYKIVSYNHTTKTVRYQAVDGFPNDTIKPEIGDTFTFVDIEMPSAYVTNALTRLEAEAQAYLDIHSGGSHVIYNFEADILNMKRMGFQLLAGDIVTVRNIDIGLDDAIRVNGASYPADFSLTGNLRKGMKYTAEVGNILTWSDREKLYKDLREQQVAAKSNASAIEESNRINSANIRAIDLDFVVTNGDQTEKGVVLNGYFAPPQTAPVAPLSGRKYLWIE